MASQRLSDMTLEELQAFINTAVDRRLQELLRPASARTPQEVRESVRRNRWTPPSGTPSTLQLLREDRDQ